MRLRKIGLGNPHHCTDGYGNLFFPHCEPSSLQMPNALGIYVDKVISAEEELVKKHFKENYRFSSSSDHEVPAGKISSYLFRDYSPIVADADGKTLNSLGAQNRNALLTVFPKETYINGIGVGECMGSIMEMPMVRGGVLPFEDGCAYIEIANGKQGKWVHSDPALSILETIITEFETPAHKRILREILAGTITEFTESALYEHLRETGQTDKWLAQAY